MLKSRKNKAETDALKEEIFASVSEIRKKMRASEKNDSIEWRISVFKSDFFMPIMIVFEADEERANKRFLEIKADWATRDARAIIYLDRRDCTPWQEASV